MRKSDKVAVVAGPHAGRRGRIASTRGAGGIAVELDKNEGTITVTPDELRNFSVAARKAWKTAPSRRVGRPAGKSLHRVSITLRIDVHLWQRFLSLEGCGRIDSRSSFIESALAKAMQEAERQAE
jgi:hypothetical protein